jgi:hypothetical protein
MDTVRSPEHTQVPLHMSVRAHADRGAPIVLLQPRHPCSLAYNQLALQVKQRVLGGRASTSERPASHGPQATRFDEKECSQQQHSDVGGRARLVAEHDTYEPDQQHHHNHPLHSHHPQIILEAS